MVALILVIALALTSMVWQASAVSAATPGTARSTSHGPKPVPRFKHLPPKKTSKPVTPAKQLSIADRDAHMKSEALLAPLATRLPPGQIDKLRSSAEKQTPDKPDVTVGTPRSTTAGPAEPHAAAAVPVPAPENLQTPQFPMPGQTTWGVMFYTPPPAGCTNCLTWGQYQIDIRNAQDNSLVWSFVYSGIWYDPSHNPPSFNDPTVPSFADMRCIGSDLPDNTCIADIADGPLRGLGGTSLYADVSIVDVNISTDSGGNYVKTITDTGPTVASPAAPALLTPGIPPDQSGGPTCPCHSADRADPVDTATGMVHESVVDASIAGAGIPFGVIRSYRSTAQATGGLLGKGWALQIESSLNVGASSATLTDLDGSRVAFTRATGGGYTSAAPAHYTLTATGGGYVVTDIGNQTRRTFDASGKLVSWTDHNGTGYSIARDASGRIASVTDAAGRISTFTVDAATGLLQMVKLPDNSAVQYSYTNGQLSQVTAPDGGLTRYTYDAAGRLATTVDPRNKTVSQNTYDPNTGRATKQIDAGGATTTFAWTPDSNGVAGSGRADTTGPDGGVWSDYYAAGVLTGSVSPNGQWTDHGVDSNLNVAVSYTSATGDTVNTYDANGNVLTSTDDQGDKDTYTYNSNNQVLSHTDALQHKTTYDYNAAGQLQTVTDPRGNPTKYTYAANGQVATVTRPRGGVTINTYDAQNNVDSSTNADGKKTTFTYDGLGHKLTETDPLGKTTKYTYDAAGRVLTTTDPLGNVTTNVYDPAGNLESTTDADNHKTGYEYDAAGRQTSMTDPLNHITKTTYDAAGRQASTVDPLGNTTTYGYDQSGHQVSITDPTSAVSTMTYDSTGRLTAKSDYIGNVAKTAYDSLGQVTSTTDATGAVTTNDYDPAGRLADVINPDGKTSYTYDENGNRLTQVTALGETTSWTYDADGNVSSVTDPRGHVAGANEAAYTTSYTYDKAGRKLTATDPLGRTTHYDYDDDGHLTVVTDPLGHKTTTGYDDDGRATTVTDANAKSTITEYDPVGNVRSVTDPMGNKTSYTYDDAGRRKTLTSPRGNLPGADPAAFTTTYDYDADGNVTKVTGPTGAITSTMYDQDNHVTQITDPLLNNTVEASDAAGNLLAVVDQLGAQTSYTYDGANRLTSTTDDLGNVVADGYDGAGHRTVHTTPLGKTTWSYDADGHMTGMVDPRGNVAGANPATYTTSYGYDPAGNQTKVTDPLGHATKTDFDAANQVVTVTDPAGKATGYTYDDAGHLKTVTAADTGVTAYDYDNVGNLTSRTDANSHVTGYGYDFDKRLTSTTDPAGNVVGYGYDADGNPNSKTNARGAVATVTYDARNLPTDITYSDGTHAIGYAYNPAGQRTGITDASGSRTLDYDPDGRILSVTQPGATTPFTYKYNSVGEITSRTYPDSDSTTYAWSNGVQTSQTDSGSTVSYNYDPAGRLLSAKMPAANGYTESRTYDAAGNLATIGTAKTGSALSAWTINRDEDNRPTSIIATRTGQATTTKSYTYDPTGRILSESCSAASTSLDCPGGSQNTAWTYDKVGNRQTQIADGTTTSYRYNNLDQLTSSAVGSVTTDYGYDLDGNLTSDGTSTYTYDAANHLDGVTTNGTATTFTLDDQGNRIAVTTGSSTQNLVWDINNPLPQLAYQTRATSNLGDYHYDPTGVPQSLKTSSGSLFLTHDGMGSIADLIDQNGAPQAQYGYTAFGIESSASTSFPAAIAANPFGFTGQLNDSAVNGDQDLRARDYDPTTGRFTGRDPIDLRTGDPYVAAYVYAENQPTTMMDPSGNTVVDPGSGGGLGTGQSGLFQAGTAGTLTAFLATLPVDTALLSEIGGAAGAGGGAAGGRLFGGALGGPVGILGAALVDVLATANPTAGAPKGTPVIPGQTIIDYSKTLVVKQKSIRQFGYGDVWPESRESCAPGNSFVVYRPLDSLGRATGVTACLNDGDFNYLDDKGNWAKTTEPTEIVGTPAEWPINYDQVPEGYCKASGLNRGHLLARILGGDGEEPRNLVTIWRKVNDPEMKAFETKANNWVTSGYTVFYAVFPFYRSANNTGLPDSINMMLMVMDTGYLDYVTIDNVPEPF